MDEPGSCGWRVVDIVAEGLELANELRGGLGGVEAIEEGAAKIPVGGSTVEDEVGGTEEVGGDGLLGAAPVLEALEPGPGVGVLHGDGWPRARDEHRFEPGRALADTGALPLAGALAQLGAESGPRHQVAHGGETAHVESDLGKEDRGGGGSDAGDGA